MAPDKTRERRPIQRLALSRAEVALTIGVSVGSVDQMVAEGVLPPPRQWHSRKLWLVSEVEAHLNDLPMAGEFTKSMDHRQAAHAPSRPLSLSPMPDELREWYARIGFNPQTMNETDRIRLMKEADERWKATIPGKPPGKLERGALLQMTKYEVGEFIAFHKIKRCGGDTSDRLAARGFIEVRMREPDILEGFILTPVGLEAAKALEASGSK